jgi:hypothetical protein
LRFVEEDQKEIGDGAFAYWTGTTSGNSTAELKYFRDMARYNYDSAKIYTEELLSIADQTQQTIKENLGNDISIAINRMKQNIAAIGLESDQIESLGWVLTQHKNKHKRNLQGMFDMILDWLDSIEQSVDQTDADTKYIFDLIQKLNTNVLIGEIMLKAEDLMTNLRKIDMKANVIKDSPELKMIDKELSLGNWQNYIDEFKTNLEDNIRDNHKKSLSSSASYGFWILCFVGVVLLSGFVYLYVRLQKAIKNNQVTG